MRYKDFFKINFPVVVLFTVFNLIINFGFNFKTIFEIFSVFDEFTCTIVLFGIFCDIWNTILLTAIFILNILWQLFLANAVIMLYNKLRS